MLYKLVFTGNFNFNFYVYICSVGFPKIRITAQLYQVLLCCVLTLLNIFGIL